MRCLLLLLTCFILTLYCFSQNVGIGTTTPIDKLTIHTATNLPGITHTDGTIRLSTFLGGSTNGGWVGTVSNHPLSFFTNNSNALVTISTSGNVGIHTSTPSFPLSIKTTGATYGLMQDNGNVFVGTYAGSTSGFNAGWYGTYSDHPLAFFTNNGNAQMTLLQNGNVGIGTTAPVGPLDVRRASSSLGTAFFQGTTYGSVFNYSTAEDTYIRGGKAGSNVIINDAAPLGKVGIGTDIPADKLTVRTSSNTYGLTHTDGVITVGSYVGGGAGWLGTKSNHPLYFFTNNGQAQLAINTNGQVSINGAPSVYGNRFTIHGQLTLNYDNSATEWDMAPGPDFLFIHRNNSLIASISSDGDWYSLSDKTLKENILPFKPILADLRNLQVCTYRYKSHLPGSRSFGLIAQNVAEYFPEIVSEIIGKDGQKLLAISYGKTGVLALKAIQEQQVFIETLQNKIEQLEKRFLELEKLSRQKP